MYMYRNIYHNDARKHLMLLVAMFYVPEKLLSLGKKFLCMISGPNDNFPYTCINK